LPKNFAGGAISMPNRFGNLSRLFSGPYAQALGTG
jgi:hypothetical protein